MSSVTIPFHISVLAMFSTDTSVWTSIVPAKLSQFACFFNTPSSSLSLYIPFLLLLLHPKKKHSLHTGRTCLSIVRAPIKASCGKGRQQQQQAGKQAGRQAIHRTIQNGGRCVPISHETQNAHRARISVSVLVFGCSVGLSVGVLFFSIFLYSVNVSVQRSTSAAPRVRALLGLLCALPLRYRFKFKPHQRAT